MDMLEALMGAGASGPAGVALAGAQPAYRAPRAAGYAGAGQALVEGLLGRTSPAAYQRGMANAADAQSKVLAARKARDEEVGRTVRREEVAKTLPPAQASLVNGLLDSGETYTGAMSGEKTRHELAVRERAHAAAIGRYGENDPNAHLFALAAGPQSMQQAMGSGGYIADRFDSDAPVQLTEMGQAEIAVKATQATQNLASAGASNAMTRLRDAQTSTGGWSPHTGAGAGKPGTYTAPSKATLDMLFASTRTDQYGAAIAGADPVEIERFNVWRQTRPELTNGEQAAAVYTAERKRTRDAGPIFIEPGNPASMLQAPPAPADANSLEANLRADGLPPDMVAKIAAAAASGKEFSIPVTPGKAAPVKVTSKVQMDALPSGTRFIAPDGTTRVKP